MLYLLPEAVDGESELVAEGDDAAFSALEALLLLLLLLAALLPFVAV